MRFMWAGLLSCFAFSTSCFATELEYYKSVPTYQQDVQECDADDIGQFQMSCRYIEVGNIDGQQVTESQYGRLGRLEKYRLGGTYLKIAGVGCGRGQTTVQAERNALGKAVKLVKNQIEDFEETKLAPVSPYLGFNKFDEASKCVPTPNTSNSDGNSLSAKQNQNNNNSLSKSPVNLNQQTKKDENTATFIVHNKDRYAVSIAFFSQTRSGIVWPQAGHHWTLQRDNTYKLACKPGEKICYGAWREYQTLYWGAGQGNEGCDSCCLTCGGSMERTLNDAGPDSYPAQASNGNAVDDLANILGAIGLGVQIGNAINQSSGGYSNSGSVQTYAPSAKRYNGSGISGEVHQ